MNAPSRRSDDEANALVRLAAGDVEALGTLYDLHARALHRFAARIVPAAEVEDIVQQTFLTAMRVASSFDGNRSASARPWLIGIAARLVQQRRRSIARFARALLRSGNPTVAAATAARSDIERALASLPESKRVVVVLADVEGYTANEISEMLDIPIGTVFTRLHHARKALRAFFGDAS